jgi:hypothetical protein
VQKEYLFKSPDVFALSMLVLSPKHEIGTATMRGRTSDNHVIDCAGGQLLETKAILGKGMPRGKAPDHIKVRANTKCQEDQRAAGL